MGKPYGEKRIQETDTKNTNYKVRNSCKKYKIQYI